MKKIVLTGSSGIIGSFLTRKFFDTNEFNFIPLSRKECNYKTTRVSNYKYAPNADIIFHLAEESNRHVINSQNSEYLNKKTETL